MSHGLPDYYRGVDIAYQALSEMIVRPKYGSADNIMGLTTARANEAVKLVSKSGKGVIYGGFVYLKYTSTQKGSLVYMTLDDNILSTLTFLNLYKYKVNKPRSATLYLLSYNDSTSEYAVGISSGLTFESSFELWYDEKEGTTPDIVCSVDYALIT